MKTHAAHVGSNDHTSWLAAAHNSLFNIVLWEMCFVLLYGERGDAAMTRRHLHSFFSAGVNYAHGISAEIKYAHIRVKHFFSRFHFRMRCKKSRMSRRLRCSRHMCKEFQSYFMGSNSGLIQSTLEYCEFFQFRPNGQFALKSK